MTGDRRWPPEENCYCGGPESALYPHRKGTGRHCRPDTAATGDRTPAGDLRERLAHAIRERVRISPRPNALADLNAGRSIAISGGEADDAALAVLPVVEAETAALRKRLTEALHLLDNAHANHEVGDIEDDLRAILTGQQPTPDTRPGLLDPEDFRSRRSRHRDE